MPEYVISSQVFKRDRQNLSRIENQFQKIEFFLFHQNIHFGKLF